MKSENSSIVKGFYNSRSRYIRLAAYLVVAAIVGIVFADSERPITPWLGFLVLVVSFVEIFIIGRTQKKFVKYIENLNFCLNDSSKGTLFNYPSPIVITDKAGSISWYNELFAKATSQEEALFGKNVQELIPKLQIEKLLSQGDKIRSELEIGENHYEVWCDVVHAKGKGKQKKGTDLIIFYFVDKTNEVNAIRLRAEERMIESIIIIDNYDEVLKETEDSNHGALLGEIEQTINNWVNLGAGVLRKYERDKFIAVFSAKNFEKITENKFAVLDEVRSIDHDNKIPVTLSIGVGMNGEDVLENDKFARLAIDMALGRGGDQVVVRDGENFTFYGAKTREVEKRTKVKARVVAHALRELIDHADRVIIMGHKNSDMDCVGAAIGIFRAVKSRGKEAYIVNESDTVNSRMLIEEFSRIPEYDDAFISAEQTLNVFTPGTLVVVVDVHRPSMVDCPELLQHAKDVVLIDHHRKSEDFIENPVLVYHEPYASSTCEMITEIFQYIQDGQRLTKKEAEALYAGIYMDTKGFNFKAGVRTFEAASYLRRMGVDPVSVRRLFKTDLENYIARADIIRTATIYRENIAFSYLYEECPDMAVTVAQAADELLNISGVEASFVLAKDGNRVLISGRSLDNINVQVILEKLGGGGHITIAGAQLEDVTIEEADEKLKNAIEEVLSE